LKKIFLIGMMGSGKTTIGKVLSENLRFHFEDLDKTIESIFKLSTNEIFLKYGEKEFRNAETKALLNSEAVIISCGGGVILKRENRSFIKKGVSFFLNVDLNELVRRLEHANNRPLLNSKNLKEDLESLWKKRKDLYLDTADYVININNESPNDIAQKIMEYVK
tara:strand:- start:4075 stop:4566 length:492 start_codon:yes stop_codon:yes gene_type:complete